MTLTEGIPAITEDINLKTQVTYMCNKLGIVQHQI